MLRRTLLALAPTLLAAPALRAETYPSRPIRIVSPFPPGGGTDLLSRAIGQRLAEAKGWTVVVENRAGANGTIGLGEVARAAPTGYELVLGQQDNMILSPLLTKVPFDSAQDFSPVAFVGTTPLILLVAANSPHRSMADLVAASKARKGELSFGSSGAGSNSHIILEMLRRRAGLEMQHVPYRGSGPALADLLGGHVAAIGTSIASAKGALDAGTARALAVSGPARSPSLPQVPTLMEGGTQVNVTTWWAMLGPKGLPEPVVGQLNAAINGLLTRPDLLKVMADSGVEPAAMTPAAFDAFLKRELETWKGIIAEIDLKLD